MNQRTERVQGVPSNEAVTSLELLHALVWQLLDVNPEVRLEAICKMRELGSAVKLALPDIINALNDPEEIIRHNAFRLLCAICPDVENDAASLAAENVEARLAVIRKLVTLSEVKDAIAARNPSWPSLEQLTSSRSHVNYTTGLPSLAARHRLECTSSSFFNDRC